MKVKKLIVYLLILGVIIVFILGVVMGFVEVRISYGEGILLFEKNPIFLGGFSKKI